MKAAANGLLRKKGKSCTRVTSLKDDDAIDIEEEPEEVMASIVPPVPERRPAPVPCLLSRWKCIYMSWFQVSTVRG